MTPPAAAIMMLAMNRQTALIQLFVPMPMKNNPRIEIGQPQANSHHQK
jgi:hypothetical protein